MKSEFWASIIAVIVIVICTIIVWLVNGRPVEFTQGESMSITLALTALYLVVKYYLLREED